MKEVEINGLKTKGKIESNLIASIPLRKNVAIVLTEFLVGRYDGDKFIVHYQLDDPTNVDCCVDQLKREYPSSSIVLLKVVNKVIRL